MAKGEYQYSPRLDAKQLQALRKEFNLDQADVIALFGSQAGPQEQLVGVAPFDELFGALGDWIGAPVFSELEQPPQRSIACSVNCQKPATDEARKEEYDPLLVLPNVSDQTGLQFEQQVRKLPILFVEEAAIEKPAKDRP